MSKPETTNNDHHIDKFTLALESGALLPVKNMLESLHPAEIAHLIESSPRPQRKMLWQLLDSSARGEVLVELGDEVQSSLIQEMPARAVAKATEALDTDDLADLIQNLPGTVTHKVLGIMTDRDRQRLNQVIAYDEDTAGGMMNTDAVTIRGDVTVDVVQRYLRLRGHLPDHTDSLYVVDRENHLLGTLPVVYLLTQDDEDHVEDIMHTDLPALQVDLASNDVAKIFEKRDLLSAPVISEQGYLLGRITVDDVVDVIREQADHDIMGRAGLNEDDDMFAPVIHSTKRRAIWLGINLITALLAAWVIGNFQATLQQVVALAVLMPIVASMGGVAGTQTLTLVIRAIALDQVGKQNLRWLLNKELLVGFLNGLIWSGIVAIIAYAWFGNLTIGAIIAAAMIINLVVASLSGVIIPLVMHRFSIDPALAGGVALTTVTDVVGFLTFLGLASLIL